MDLGEKLGPFPRWAWALGAGGLIGLLWIWRSRSSTPAPVTTSADASDTPGDPSPTTIVPYPSGGIAEDQYEQLLAAIRALQGPASTTPSSTGTTKGGGPWIGPLPPVQGVPLGLPPSNPFKNAR